MSTDADITDAVRETLATYLRTQLDVSVTVVTDWPSERRPAQCVAITTAPDAQEERFPPSELSFTRTSGQVTAHTGTLTYAIGRFKLPVQIDVWASYPVQRTAILAALRAALHRHPSLTMTTPAVPPLPQAVLTYWPELVLNSAPLAGSRMAFTFDESNLTIDNNDVLVQSSAAHAMLDGMAEGLLVHSEDTFAMDTIDVIVNDEDNIDS